MQEGSGVRLVSFFVVTVVIFLGLTARLVYLGASRVERVAAANGLEVEIFRQYPASAETGAPVRPRQVRVPALVGRSFSQAGEAAASVGLLLEGMGDVKGRVIRQEPPAGRLAPEGTAVRVWLEAR